VKTLVTGASGFIGTHLVKALVEEGRDVRCLVRKTSNTQYLDDLGVELFYGELASKETLAGIAKDVDIVYHLAGEVYTKRCKNFYIANFEGTKNLIEACFLNHIEKFIYLSSIAAVGPNQSQNVLLNERSQCKPIDSYGKSKLKSENLLIQIFKKYGFPAVIIRAPTVYGPLGQPKIITRIVRMVNSGRLLIVGDKKKLRSMCYIDNLINGLTKAENFKDSIGEIYFIADERPYYYDEIFQAVSRNIETNLQETHVPGWIGHTCGFLFKCLSTFGFYSLPLYMAWHMVLDMACDIRKAREQLKYIPHIELDEGINVTMKYFLKK